MGSIHLLSDLVASQVAAGEVVERPASVLKELVENSIDAGATRIEVAFQQGGIKLLRVTDNGCGMDRSDALLSLERHATSKMQTLHDLSAIGTFGFRGEAVPSIASVSRFRLSTRPHDEVEGTEIIVEGGKILEVRASGQASGTQIEIRDLFFNVPARRKFLKSESTETAHLLQQLQILAVAHPEIAFTCLQDHREVFRLAAPTSLAVRLRDLYGASFLERMKEIPLLEVEGIKVHGFFARPGEGRTDRSQQLLFINGRMIRSPLLSQALREACDGILPKGLSPQAVLFFQLDPAKVDCNVHPAKREVRFQEPGKIKVAALRAAAEVMGNYAHVASPLPLQNVARPYAVERSSAVSSFLPPIKTSVVEEQSFLLPQLSPFSSSSEQPPQGPSDVSVLSADKQEPPAFGYVGSVGERYFILEEGDGFVLVEIRAALERIIYEQWRRSLAHGMLERQRLLLSEIVEVSPSEFAWVMSHQHFLEQVGLEIDTFGKSSSSAATQSLKIDAVPVLLKEIPVASLLHQLLEDLQSEESKNKGRAVSHTQLIEEVLARSVSRMAACAQRVLHEKTAALMLVRDLLKCELPYATPAGRPTMIQFSEGELQRKFGR